MPIPHCPTQNTRREAALHNNERMKQKLVGGLLTVLLIPVLGLTSSTHAEQPREVEASSEANQLTGAGVAGRPLAQTVDVALKPTSDQRSSPVKSQRVEVVKVGEYQQGAKDEIDPNVIAKIQPHAWAGRPAATVYLRNIPVLTFVGSRVEGDAKMDSIKPATSQNSSQETIKPASSATVSEVADPVWRATAIAAKLNQMSRDNVDANKIEVRWAGSSTNPANAASDHYIIEANGEELVAIDEQTILPDTTKDPAQDALQATNRLRRLLGKAPPLEKIAGKPEPEPPAISFRSLQQTLKGWASWYGPGFDGQASASGETFNQEALTAAHRDLPFGTLVQVTNLDNGQSVVVRINDRGPFIPDRIIDLSAGAAKALGMMNSGVAPVQLDVLDLQQTATFGQ